jgi:GNAT superfamily N-acetyltransferase
MIGLVTSDIDIRPLSDADLEGALGLSASCGWNQRAADWHMLLQIAPSGSFAAVDGDRIVGTAIGIDYGGFGWIAMMLVDPEYRRQGVGARLLEAAMGAVPPELPLRLDATPLGRPLYEHYGFELESSLTRHVRPAGAPPPAAPDGEVRRLTESDLNDVMRSDDRLSGAHRHGAIRWAFSDSPHYAWIGDPPGDSPRYCLGRGGRLFDHLGPIVADRTESAIALTTAAIAQSEGRALVIDAHETHDAFTAWLTSAGFEPQRPLYRMRRRGDAPAPATRRDGVSVEFAVMGPEFS